MNAPFDDRAEGPEIHPATLREELEKLLRYGEGWMTENGLAARCRLAQNAGEVYRVLGELEQSGLIESRNRGTRGALYRHKTTKVAAPARDPHLTATGGEATASPPAGASLLPHGAPPRRPVAPTTSPPCVSQAKSDQEQTPMKTQPPGRPSPVRDKILALLKSGPRSVIDLAKATDASDALVSYHLKTLEQRRLVGRSDPKDRRSKWQLSGRGMTSVAATTANPAPAQRARGRKCAQPPVDGLAAALQRLRPLDRAPISDLDTKVQVLDRLGRVVDPTIAAVLTAISKDLRAAA